MGSRSAFDDLLAPLEAAQAAVREQPQPGCGEARIETLRRRAEAELGHALPEDFCAFLRVRDGLNHNGLVIYSSETSPIVGNPTVSIQGVVEANLAWRDDAYFAYYLILGEGNLDLYVLHRPSGDYHVIDRTPGNLIETHDSFRSLLATALAAHA